MMSPWPRLSFDRGRRRCRLAGRLSRRAEGDARFECQTQDSCKKRPPRDTNTSGGCSALLDQNPESLFKSWLAEHAGAILKVARAYTLTAEDCQDLVQEILLQVWRSLPQFQGRASASTWLYRVALNTALGWHRKEHRRQVRQRPILEVEDLPIDGPDGAQQAGRREVVERLYAAIRRLPRAEAALVLLYLDDLSYRQIADVLGISESNVGVKLNRAKKALAKLMDEDSDGP